jgi:hypothetical protein
MRKEDILFIGGILFLIFILSGFIYLMRLQSIEEETCRNQCKPFISMKREECYCLDAEGNYNLSKPKPE